MEKNNYNLSEHLDHIAYMFNVRTTGKAYENFIVNAIYTKVGESELMPVTQQYVNATIFLIYIFLSLNMVSRLMKDTIWEKCKRHVILCVGKISELQ